MKTAKTRALARVYQREIATLEHNIAEWKRRVERLRYKIESVDLEFDGAELDHPAWALLETVLDPKHGVPEHTIGMLEDYAKQLLSRGSLSPRQIEVLESIALGDPTTRALEHACPNCRAKKGEKCVGKKQPRIKVPHDERLALLPQTRSVKVMRRDHGLTLACPVCRAEVGEKCTGPVSGTRDYPHSERVMQLYKP